MKIISKKEADDLELKRYFTGKPCKHGHVAEKYVKSDICVECDRLRKIERKEKRAAYDKKWREKNPSYHKKWQEEWRKNNPEKSREKSARYRDSEKQKEYRENNTEYFKKKNKERHENNREENLSRAKKWREENPGKFKEAKERWSLENQEHEKAQKKLWYTNNRERIKVRAKEWLEANRDKDNVRTARRRIMKLERSFYGYDEIISDIYAEAHQKASETGEKHHVDHVIPLVGKTLVDGKWIHTVSGLHVPWSLQVVPAIENVSKGCYMR